MSDVSGDTSKEQVPYAEMSIGTFHECCSDVYKVACVVGEVFTDYLQECYQMRKQETPSLPFHWLSSLQEFPSLIRMVSQFHPQQ